MDAFELEYVLESNRPVSYETRVVHAHRLAIETGELHNTASKIFIGPII